MKNTIALADDRESMPFSADPLSAPTDATLASIAASLDRLIGMQLVLAQHQERLEAGLSAIRREMQSNMNAYLGWTQEFANCIKAR